jgi:RNA polymerase sigma-70 factor (ECF subfamily)
LITLIGSIFSLESLMPATLPKTPDYELMRALAKGDSDALSILAARYTAMLTAHAWRVLRDESDAQEVAADVLWQIWRDSTAFSPQRGALATWLITLVHNRAIDRLRVRHPCEALNGHQIDRCAPDPAVEIDRAHARAWSERRSPASTRPSARCSNWHTSPI